MKRPPELDLDQDWRIGERAFDLICRQLGQVHLRSIVEFGAGASSVRLAQRFPEAQILAIDHGPEFAQSTFDLARRFDVESRLTVQCRRLRWGTWGAGVYQGYRRGSLPPSIDAVIIDGPPFYAFHGREACLYQSWHLLRVGGLVFLDDCARRNERISFRNWRLRVGAAGQFQQHEVGHGIGVVRKVSDGRLRVLPLRKLLGRYLELAKLLAGRDQ